MIYQLVPLLTPVSCRWTVTLSFLRDSLTRLWTTLIDLQSQLFCQWVTIPAIKGVSVKGSRVQYLTSVYNTTVLSR